jgi:alanine racemase
MPYVPLLTIDLGAIQHNYRLLAQKAAPAECAAAVKADGYGLGVKPVVEALYEAGCRTFFTAYPSEALEVRKALKDATVAPLHGLAPDDYDIALKHNITPVLNSLGDIEGWAVFAKRHNKKLPAFIHLDSGMNRLGLPPDEQERLIADPARLEGIEIKAWLSHFACSEDLANPLTTRQRDAFKAALAKLPKAKACLCNSSGIFWGKDYVFDLVRAGVALYGVNPTPAAQNPMRDVIELQAPILQIRHVDSPMTVGYGATHRIARKGRIATLALGYADGYLRALSSKGQVKIGSFLAPVVGRISMDLTTVDISDVPEAAARVGTYATVIGAHRSVDTVAAEAGTIGYEILTSLGARFERRYSRASAA